MMEIDISKMTLNDIEEISPILHTEFDDFWSVNILKNELQNKNSYIFTAKYKKQIVGFVAIWTIFSEAHLTNIVVRKNYQNLKIGSRLLDYIIDFSVSLHLNSITLEVNSSNIIAQKLYSKFNFATVGKRPNYYSNHEDAILMTKFLN